MIDLLAIFILFFVALIFVTWPLRRSGDDGMDFILQDDAANLEDKKNKIIAQFRISRNEHQQNKISDQQWRRIQEYLFDRYCDVVRRMEKSAL